MKCLTCGSNEGGTYGFGGVDVEKHATLSRMPLPYFTLLMCPCGRRSFKEFALQLEFRKHTTFIFFDAKPPFVHLMKVPRRNYTSQNGGD